MSNLKFYLTLIPSILAGSFCILIVIFLWKRRAKESVQALILLFISLAGWSVGYSFEQMVQVLPAKTLWLKFEFIGLCWLTTFWLFFCIRYTGKYELTRKRFFSIFSWVPIITLGMVFTNELHNLFWSEINLKSEFGMVVFDMVYGPWFWGHISYSFLLYLAGLWIIIQHYFNSSESQRYHIRLILIAGLIPVVAILIYLTNLNPFPYLDLNALSLLVAGIIFVYVYFNHHFFDIVPIARDTTFENMSDGILVVDLNDRIVDINPAAEQVLQLSISDILGRSASDVLPELTEWINDSKDAVTPVKTLITGEGSSKRIFTLKYLPLSDPEEVLVGYTILFHDHTESYTLTKDLENQASRLAVLYEIGKAITSTLNIDALLELIHVQISKVIQSDTYFVALYLPETHQIEIRILYEDGIRHPSLTVSADEGLSSWIVKNKTPLLIHDLRKEIDSLSMSPIMVGEKKLSRSWLGVPLLTEQNLIGLLAVASYKPNMFDETDKLLMEQIGQQAVLSIQNARHYEEVSRQAKLDSLTGVSNHNHFIEILYQGSDLALKSHSPLSLIMLDIDHFKLYNDTYGHTIGDQVLRLTVQAIESHIKKTDTVGRWGGEEFGIVLPNATTTQANMVANRIRRTLSELPLFNVEGNTIPKPTISQGIASIPHHTTDADELVVIADRALYRAKARGRDQVAVGIPSESVKNPEPKSN
jgi:diguanylate cyclase (GGDEF)-like protein